VPGDELLGGDAARNVAIFDHVLEGKQSAYRDLVALNAGAALVVTGHADDLVEGVERAFASIDSGAAHAVLERVRSICLSAA
jgi:anthranilate phosphoribosyltransferase